MENWTEYFKGKKVTVMGLGLLGRGVGDAEFLALNGAELLITDLKSTEELAPSLERLKKYPNITYHLGGHTLADFRNRDFILKAAGVPLDSLFIAEARKNGIPVEMDASLFVKLSSTVPGTGAPNITTIGVTGTRGKSTTSVLIYEILKAAGKRVFLAGNIKDTATLPLLEKVETGDCVVLELDSWQLQGFGDAHISPHIAVFTTFMPDHMNYYQNDPKAPEALGQAMQRYFEDKAQIFRHQKLGDHLVVGEDIAEKFDWNNARQLHIALRKDVPRDWTVHLPGEHNRLNAACALAVAKILGIKKDDSLRRVFNAFTGLAGRLELKRMINGVAYYNDTNATTPDATIAGLRAVGRGKNVVLIMGGSDKGLDMADLIAEIPKNCKAVVLLAGSGTEALKTRGHTFDIETKEAKNLEEALNVAREVAVKGDIVLFSPAFASFGMFENEYDRGEQFNKLLSSLEPVHNLIAK